MRSLARGRPDDWLPHVNRQEHPEHKCERSNQTWETEGSRGEQTCEYRAEEREDWKQDEDRDAENLEIDKRNDAAGHPQNGRHCPKGLPVSESHLPLSLRQTAVRAIGSRAPAHNRATQSCKILQPARFELAQITQRVGYFQKQTFDLFLRRSDRLVVVLRLLTAGSREPVRIRADLDGRTRSRQSRPD